MRRLHTLNWRHQYVSVHRTLSTRDGDIINLRTANAIVNSIEAEEVSIPHIVSRWRVHFMVISVPRK
jgi:hypothetical protein